jgi:hypothetical protein
MRKLWLMALLGGSVAAAGCSGAEAREARLPQAASVAAWFGEGTQARISGNVLEVRGEIDPDFLRRGGRIWERSGPYFYLFNVRVRDLLEEYPDLAAVRAVTLAPDGRELARAELHREELSVYEWKEALARASLAQRQGTKSPRRIEELIRYGEDHTKFRYSK